MLAKLNTRLFLIILVMIAVVVIAVFYHTSSIDIDDEDSSGNINLSTSTQFLSDKSPVTYIDGITSVAYIVGNIKNGAIYYSRKADKVLSVASMSKLITAVVATNSMSSSTVITITESETKVPVDASNLLVDEKFTLTELLYPMLLNSSNVAAEAIASSTDRNKFLNLMSSYAWEIGMPHAFFADPTGLSPKNHASAREMFALAQYLYDIRPDILSLTRNEHIDMATTTDHGGHSIDSTHPFVKDQRFIGGKTGRTLAAGETMMTLMNMEDGKKVVFIVIGSQYGERESDTLKLIDKYENKKF